VGLEGEPGGLEKGEVLGLLGGRGRGQGEDKADD
jgi:hypothetical protein